MDNKTIAIEAVQALFVDFDAEAARPMLSDTYIQHNPGVPSGPEPFVGMLGALKESGLAAVPHRTLAEGDLVVMHSTYENAQLFGADTLVAFDIFRIEDGKIAEHWDNLQAPGAVNASGRSQTDGTTEITDLDKTAENKAVALSFMRDVLMGADPGKVVEYVSTEEYLQHNPMVGDGLEALGAAMADMAAAGQAMVYTQHHMTVAEGNFVFTYAEGTVGDEPTAFADLFRLDGGKIVEHWDVMAAIPPASEFAHDNGKF